jgi:phosphoglycolate phosphatase
MVSVMNIVHLELLQPPVVGFDLDLTLIDTRVATAHALQAVNQELGEHIDVDAFVARLGPPVRDELRPWVPESRLDAAIATFRTTFTSTGLRYLRPCAGAADILHALRRAGGRSVVITSRRPFIAQAALEATGLHAAALVGGLTGTEKASAMTENGVAAYVGDHALDMIGASAARVPGVGVLTGAHNEDELRAAGASLVVPTLTELLAVLRL